MEQNEIIYEKINNNYRHLENIMGSFYDGNLNYEEVLPALSELREKLIETKKDCDNKILFNRIEEVIKYTEDIMQAIYESKVNKEEIIPTLGELAMNMLGAQKYTIGTNQYLENIIEDKERCLSEALISTRNKKNNQLKIKYN